MVILFPICLVFVTVVSVYIYHIFCNNRWCQLWCKIYCTSKL